MKILFILAALVGIVFGFLFPEASFGQQATSIGHYMHLVEYNGIVYEKHYNSDERRSLKHRLTRVYEGVVEVEFTGRRAKLYVGGVLIIEGNIKQGIAGCKTAFRYVEWDAMLHYEEAEQQARARSPWCLKGSVVS